MSISKIEDALSIEVGVADWEGLGELLALQNSNDQAFMLLGFWGNVRDDQVPWIANSGVFGKANESTRAEVADFYRSLADAIEGGGPIR